MVSEAFKNHGVGRELIQRLVEVANRRGVKGFTVDVPTENSHAVHLFDDCGRAEEAETDNETIRLMSAFDEPPPAGPWWRVALRNGCN